MNHEIEKASISEGVTRRNFLSVSSAALAFGDNCGNNRARAGAGRHAQSIGRPLFQQSWAGK
jgi:hypothetical protein